MAIPMIHATDVHGNIRHMSVRLIVEVVEMADAKNNQFIEKDDDRIVDVEVRQMNRATSLFAGNEAAHVLEAWNAMGA